MAFSNTQKLSFLVLLLGFVKGQFPPPCIHYENLNPSTEGPRAIAGLPPIHRSRMVIAEVGITTSQYMPGHTFSYPEGAVCAVMGAYSVGPNGDIQLHHTSFADGSIVDINIGEYEVYIGGLLNATEPAEFQLNTLLDATRGVYTEAFSFEEFTPYTSSARSKILLESKKKKKREPFRAVGAEFFISQKQVCVDSSDQNDDSFSYSASALCVESPSYYDPQEDEYSYPVSYFFQVVPAKQTPLFAIPNLYLVASFENPWNPPFAEAKPENTTDN